MKQQTCSLPVRSVKSKCIISHNAINPFFKILLKLLDIIEILFILKENW